MTPALMPVLAAAAHISWQSAVVEPNGLVAMTCLPAAAAFRKRSLRIQGGTKRPTRSMDSSAKMPSGSATTRLANSCVRAWSGSWRATTLTALDFSRESACRRRKSPQPNMPIEWTFMWDDCLASRRKRRDGAVLWGARRGAVWHEALLGPTLARLSGSGQTKAGGWGSARKQACKGLPKEKPAVSGGLPRVEGIASALFGRAVTDLPGLPHCLDPFLKCEQRGGLAGLESATGSDREGEGCSAGIVGQPDDNDNVMITKREPGALDAATELFDRALDRLDRKSTRLN